MKSLAYILFFALCGFGLFAQDSISMQKKWEIDISTDAIWTVDHLNQLFIAERDLLKKYNENGKQLFVQSLKKFGEITEIDPKNPMKVLLFSEQQQYLIFLDNTLSRQNEIELDQYQLSYVTHVASSVQPDKIWIFDQENSKINLIATKEQQSIRLENLGGLLDMKNVIRMFEKEEQLFVIDSLKGVYVFDLFGTLLDFHEVKGSKWIDYDQSYLYILRDGNLEVQNLETGTKTGLLLPVKEVEEFLINKKRLYLQTKNKLYRFDIEIL